MKYKTYPCLSLVTVTAQVKVLKQTAMHSHVVLALEENNMKSSQTIFNKNEGTVTLSAVEYNKLLLYKEYALEIKNILQGSDVE